MAREGISGLFLEGREEHRAGKVDTCKLQSSLPMVLFMTDNDRRWGRLIGLSLGTSLWGF